MVKLGVFFNQVLDFLIMAAVVFFVVHRSSALLGARLAAPEAAPEPPATKECPQCAETVLARARKCKHCGSEV